MLSWRKTHEFNSVEFTLLPGFFSCGSIELGDRMALISLRVMKRASFSAATANRFAALDVPPEEPETGSDPEAEQQNWTGKNQESELGAFIPTLCRICFIAPVDLSEGTPTQLRRAFGPTRSPRKCHSLHRAAVCDTCFGRWRRQCLAMQRHVTCPICDRVSEFNHAVRKSVARRGHASLLVTETAAEIAIVEAHLATFAKRCPGCGIATEKDGGCSLLACICGTGWC